MTGAHELTVLADLTYRQVDFWTRAGYLRTTDGDPTPGTGYPREYDKDQVALAVQMSRLVRAGIPPHTAHRLAIDVLLYGRAELDGYVLTPVPTADLAGDPLPDVVRPIHREAGDAA